MYNNYIRHIYYIYVYIIQVEPSESRYENIKFLVSVDEGQKGERSNRSFVCRIVFYYD